MTHEQYLKNLSVPTGAVDVVLDTDAYNEIDDQFAIAYLLASPERANVKALYSAPFHNNNSSGPEDGMLRSYDEILKLLDFMGRAAPVYLGSRGYLPDEKTPLESPAALHLCELARGYSPEAPLYVVAIGAITNVASALLIDPSIAENIVIVWLGGHGRDYVNAVEFNMYQDIAAARVVMSSASPFVQLPCMGVASEFRISKPELDFWLAGKNKLADYLAIHTTETTEEYAHGKPWTRVIWDVTAAAWLCNDSDRFMMSRIVPVRLPEYDGHYSEVELEKEMRYVFTIHRDNLMEDLINKVLKY